jgi:hypothetical protein
MSDYLVFLSISGQIDWHTYELETDLACTEVKADLPSLSCVMRGV